MIYKIQVQHPTTSSGQEPLTPHEHTHVQENTSPTEASASGTSPIVTSSNNTPKKKLGRNDPCWCGSGKKWKKCHYPN